MSKKQSFTVTLEFSDKIVDDQDIMDIAKNIAQAIKNKVEDSGITTDFTDAYTVGVEVKPQFLDESVKLNILD
jgi:hypothetical protein